jgi:dihydroorotate dehydrogenase (NAD+) catalytic subunit
MEGFAKTYMPFLRTIGIPVIVNIWGTSVEEYAEVAAYLSQVEGIDGLEINVSCPNVKEGGIFFGTDPKMAEEVTRAVKNHAKKPISVKLSPNVTDITEMAKAAENGGADCISMINTLVGMRIDIKTKRPVLHNNRGGLSGAAIKPVAVWMIWQVRNAVKLPIIGMGGIRNGDDAIELMLAGADAVAVGTASFNEPRTVLKVIDGISAYMIDNNIKSVREITGALKIWQ